MLRATSELPAGRLCPQAPQQSGPPRWRLPGPRNFYLCRAANSGFRFGSCRPWGVRFRISTLRIYGVQGSRVISLQGLGQFRVAGERGGGGKLMKFNEGLEGLQSSEATRFWVGCTEHQSFH